MEEKEKKEIIMRYLLDNGIKPNSKGYKLLFYAILEAASYPDRSCTELFDGLASMLSNEYNKVVTPQNAYRNAYYAIKNSRNGSYNGGPFDFIKSCSIELEKM